MLDDYEVNEVDEASSSLSEEIVVLDNGQVISPNGEELFTAYLNPSLGQLRLIRTFSKRHSRKHYQGSVKSNVSTNGEGKPYSSRRSQKGKVKLLNYNIHNQLYVAGTLTLSEWPDGMLPPLHIFLNRLERHLGERFPWSAVAEYGEFGQPHWHLCLPDFFDRETLEDCWDPTGMTDFQTLDTSLDLLKWSRYMFKSFDLRKSERPTGWRFHSGLDFRPETIKFESITKADAIRLVEEQANLSGSEIREWEGPDAWCPNAYFWDVTT